MKNQQPQIILVLDFGGQYKELISRSTREQNVYSEIKSGTKTTAKDIRELMKTRDVLGLIFTGGPQSVYNENSHRCDPEIFNLGIPILGICYGMQLITHMLGGVVQKGEMSEYGTVDCFVDTNSVLLEDINGSPQVLMSHTDVATSLPEGFRVTSSTKLTKIASGESVERNVYLTQFHPEVEHTTCGKLIFENFLFNICKAKGDYLLSDYLDAQVENIKKTVGDGTVLLGLSGGVDSSVCAAILAKALPERTVCVFVDHGFMRKDEGNQIEDFFAKQPLKFIRVNAEERFLNAVNGIAEPEEKRKIIGAEFARVFEDEARKLTALGNVYLAQGTIYPDIVESGLDGGATIKSHHNVGGLPKDLGFAGVVEPLGGLFKDEVRTLGLNLGLPDFLVQRQPFPGPGLAIRIMGDVTKEKLTVLRECDSIVCCEIEDWSTTQSSCLPTASCVCPPQVLSNASCLPQRSCPQQYFCVLTNTHSVGVKGDFRTYDYVVAVRAVNTSDFMTCEYSKLPHELLSKISSRITNEIPTVSRVVYDITSKPPATVEWE